MGGGGGRVERLGGDQEATDDVQEWLEGLVTGNLMRRRHTKAGPTIRKVSYCTWRLCGEVVSCRHQHAAVNIFSKSSLDAFCTQSVLLTFWTRYEGQQFIKVQNSYLLLVGCYSHRAAASPCRLLRRYMPWPLTPPAHMFRRILLHPSWATWKSVTSQKTVILMVTSSPTEQSMSLSK